MKLSQNGGITQFLPVVSEFLPLFLLVIPQPFVCHSGPVGVAPGRFVLGPVAFFFLLINNQPNRATLAAAAGAVGGSIEDSTGRTGDHVYEMRHAAERVRAAVEASRSLPFPFTLTARAENHIVGRPDLKDTIRRLQAYQEAGADVLYAPGLVSRDEIHAVVSSVDRPVNVIMGIAGMQLTYTDLSTLGVRRISVGSALARVALGAFLRAAREMLEHGTFTFANEAASFRELNEIFKS
ncbi:MAG: isocitrate lyase/phosphoenolpyruvate mutase family protein [Acidobacteriaceae bacterium]|nr:isocitrate lyase/phosphoenolpyruvate mutase family protein [Acidobacteriaceae bacterium]